MNASPYDPASQADAVRLDFLNADERDTTASLNGKPSYTVAQAAAQISRDDETYSGTLGAPATVTYSFPTSSLGRHGGGVSGFTPFNATQIAQAQLALQSWSDVANIHFVNVAQGGQITFSNYTSGGNDSAGFTLPDDDGQYQLFGADIGINGSFSYERNPVIFGYGRQTLTHEIGHAIGLSHPGDYDSSDGEPTYEADAVYYEDSRQYSIMSYWSEEYTGAEFGDAYGAAPMLDDIAAAQRLYGANMSTRTDDTVYGFHSNTGRDFLSTDGSTIPIFAAWDAGGNDTFDFSGFENSQTIDLRQGYFSNVGGDVGNVTIAIGAVIENAIGGSGADAIHGNDADNNLFGASGDDILSGGVGHDLLDGGDGTDTAIFCDFSGRYSIAYSDGGGTVTGVDLSDRLNSIEMIQFANGTLSSDPGGGAAEIYRLYETVLGRAPDAGGFDFWTGVLADGGSLASIATDFTASAEFTTRFGGLSDAQFVDELYSVALHRDADPRGRSAYISALGDGSLTRVQMLLSFSESAEQRLDTANAVTAGLWSQDELGSAISLLYDAELNRIPDSAGLASFEQAYHQGHSLQDIASEIAGSAEFAGLYGGLDDRHYVDALYGIALGRTADPGGEAFFVQELRSGQTFGDVAYQIASSTEHQQQLLAQSVDVFG